VSRGDYTIAHSLDEGLWTQLRIAHLIEDTGQAAIQCGVYACSPKEAGFLAWTFLAEFLDMTLEA